MIVEGIELDRIPFGGIAEGDIAAISERSSLTELMCLDRERLTGALARQSDGDDKAEIEQIMADLAQNSPSLSLGQL